MMRFMTPIAAVVALVAIAPSPAAAAPLQERAAPVVLERVHPEYTPEAREAGIEGRVVLETMIRADGTVEPIRVIRSLGTALDNNAWEALAKWTFAPGTENGLPVDVRLRVEVFFSLDPEETEEPR